MRPESTFAAHHSKGIPFFNIWRNSEKILIAKYKKKNFYLKKNYYRWVWSPRSFFEFFPR